MGAGQVLALVLLLGTVTGKYSFVASQPALNIFHTHLKVQLPFLDLQILDIVLSCSYFQLVEAALTISLYFAEIHL